MSYVSTGLSLGFSVGASALLIGWGLVDRSAPRSHMWAQEVPWYRNVYIMVGLVFLIALLVSNLLLVVFTQHPTAAVRSAAVSMAFVVGLVVLSVFAVVRTTTFGEAAHGVLLGIAWGMLAVVLGSSAAAFFSTTCDLVCPPCPPCPHEDQ